MGDAITITLDAFLVDVIDRHLSDEEPDPTNLRKLNRVALIGECVVGIVNARRAALNDPREHDCDDDDCQRCHHVEALADIRRAEANPAQTASASEPEAVRVGSLVPGDELDAIATARATLECVRGWEPNVRLLGNVRADNVEHMLVTFIAHHEAAARARDGMPDIVAAADEYAKWSEHRRQNAGRPAEWARALVTTHAQLASAREECERVKGEQRARLHQAFEGGHDSSSMLHDGEVTTMRSRLARLLWKIKSERDWFEAAWLNDPIAAQFKAASATIGSECVEHVELNGHIDIAEQAMDYLANDTAESGGKADDFVASLRIVVDQCDRQRRRANWYEAAYEAGKQKLIESAVDKATAPLRKAIAELCAIGQSLAETLVVDRDRVVAVKCANQAQDRIAALLPLAKESAHG